MNVPDLEVKVVTKVRGLWKLALLTFLLRHRSAKHVVHVHLYSDKSRKCVIPTPSLTGNRPPEGPGFKGEP